MSAPFFPTGPLPRGATGAQAAAGNGPELTCINSARGEQRNYKEMTSQRVARLILSVYAWTDHRNR
jgi:hypothetical protein